MNFFIVLFLAVISDAKLIFVTVVHRHGDRTPEKVYPTDPYQESFWTEGMGILTNLGKNQLYDLGTFMRNRYSGFLPLKYHDADVYVESSEMSRNLMSAYCSLASLYEPHGDDVWSTYVKHWQPVPVYILPRAQDNKILAVLIPCPKRQRIRETIFETVLSKETKENLKKIAKEVSYFSGVNIEFNLNDLNKAAEVYDTLFVEDTHNLKLPDWTTDYYPEPLWGIKNLLHYKFSYYNNDTKRLVCGPLLKEIIQNMEKKINGTITQKWWQYSGQDTTVANVLSCLDVFDGDRPIYASAVFLELHQNEENQYEVAVAYRKNPNVVNNLIIPNCTQYCPLEKLKELVKDVIPVDWEKECNSE